MSSQGSMHLKCGAVLAFCAVLAGWGQWAQGAEPQPAGAELYYQQTLRMLDQAQKDLPEITRKAEVAAKMYVESNDLRGIAVDGESALMSEFQSRAGGLSTVVGWWPLEKKAWKGLAFFFLREGKAQADANRIQLYTDRGYKTFLFGTAEMLDEARALNVQCVETVTIPAAPHNGILQGADGNWIVPTYETGTLCTVWPFFGEFIGACTRMGKMPPVFISIAAPGGMDRFKKLQNIKWLEDIGETTTPPQPVPAGQLGKEWIDITRQLLTKMHDTQLAQIRKAAAQGAKALGDGHRAFGILTGHCTAGLPTAPHDAGYIQTIPRAWGEQHKNPEKVKEKFELQAGDFVFVDGYNSTRNEENNYKIIDYARAQGAVCAFAFASHNADEVKAVGPNEVFIDTQWELGDVVVTVPGYDIKVLPASGLLSTALYEMINAEMADLLAAKTPSASSKP